MRSHGNPNRRRRSKRWLPVIVILGALLALLVFLYLDEVADEQSPASIFDPLPTAGIATRDHRSIVVVEG